MSASHKISRYAGVVWTKGVCTVSTVATPRRRAQIDAHPGQVEELAVLVHDVGSKVVEESREPPVIPR